MPTERTYSNPIYDGYLGDPFVLKYNGEYYAYGTVPFAGCAIPVLRSTDLLSWERLGDAIAPSPTGSCVWAPEVAYRDGTFYMYYSSGGPEGEGHQLRVATASHPAGPFQESGPVLTPDDPFTIDAHPFRDEDGQWYLYYSRDFLEGERAGTGIVVDRLLDMQTLSGERATVVRAHDEWHLFEKQRDWYGQIWDWYTVEGAWVRRHEGRYYCLYSGGAWKEPNYGVSYVAADHPLGPFHPVRGTDLPQVLQTLPEKVVGPGHACIVRAPDNKTDYLVYHAWDSEHTGRMMRLDPLEWDTSGPSSPGPSLEPQPAPPMPLFRDLFDGPDGTLPSPEAWQSQDGDWRVEDGQLLQCASQSPEASAPLIGVPSLQSFLLEANLRLVETVAERGVYGVRHTGAESGSYSELAIGGAGTELSWRTVREGRETARQDLSLSALGPGFRAEHYHQLLVSVSGGTAEVWVDGVRVGSGLEALEGEGHVSLFTRNVSAAFDGISLSSLD